jgi:hypothetical protein
MLAIASNWGGCLRREGTQPKRVESGDEFNHQKGVDRIDPSMGNLEEFFAPVTQAL